MTVSAVDDTSGSGEDSIAISPALQRFEVKAGGSVSEELTVINNGQTETEFIVYSRPYSVKNEQYQPQFEKTSANTDLYQWVRFNKTSYTLGPGERVVIPYSIGVPAKAAPGGHYGVIFVETQPAQDTNESVVRKKRIGSIILANVDGDITRQGELISTHVDFWQTTPPLTASNRVENTGNTDFQAHITTVVKDMFGSVKHNQTKDYIIYPGTIRNITFEWNQASWFGLFRVEQTVKVLDDSTNASHLVLMLPRWLLVVVIALIVVGAGYGLLRRKRR
ncbi:MAG TPA: hypothetical protein VFM68_03270 [Candidatus Saccharimonadales bacterium]|nr:hypothetical protein [Candidatus Saccharimonadales bacterium]